MQPGTQRTQHEDDAARERAGVLHRRARGTGRFACEVMLPGDVDADGARASLRDGVLTIHLPKAESPRRRIALS